MSQQRPFSNSFPRRLNPTSRSSFFRDFPLDDEDMFFESNATSWDFPSRDLGSGIFDTFPRRSTMRTFPSSHHFESSSSGSHDPFSSRWHHPSWVDDELRRSRGSSPSPMDRMDSRRSPTPPNPAPSGPRSGSGSPGVNSQSFFGRNDGFPIKVVHEGTSRTPSRSSTPSSNTGEANHEASCESPTVPPPGVEKFPGVTSKPYANAYSARRQPKVHHIPIHVEPRDDGQPSRATPPPSHSDSRERVASQSDSASPSASPRQQRRAAHGQVPKKTGLPRVIPVQMDNSKPQTVPPSSDRLPTPEQHERAASPAPPRKTTLTPFEVIEGVLHAVHLMEDRVAAFSGVRTDKEYLFIDEMLTRNLIKLDNIETDGNPDLRQTRKSAIHEVNTLIHALEANVIKAPSESTNRMETDEIASEACSTVANSQKGTDESVSEQPSTVVASQEPMESEENLLSLVECNQTAAMDPSQEASTSQNGTTEGAKSATVKEAVTTDTSCPEVIENTATVTVTSASSELPTPATEQSKLECSAETSGGKKKNQLLFKTSVELQVSDDSDSNLPNGDAAPEEIMQAST